MWSASAHPEPARGGSDRIDVVLPAHNEATSIGATLQEFFDVVHHGYGIPIRFVVCEDGSTDGTADVVRDLAAHLPIELLSAPGRKGYSRAVIDGFRSTQSEIVGFIDSDGQCDPADLPTLLAALHDHDMVIGYRNPRVDAPARLVMSRAFGVVYKALFPVRVKDPSCPYLVIRRVLLERILEGHVGVLQQGFWWEFVARAVDAHASIAEVPVRHRHRISGTTQVYRPAKVPRVALSHVQGLVMLRRELHHRSRGASPIAS